MEIVDIVRKLVGPVEPVGETYSDAKRLENIEAMTALLDELMDDIFHIAAFRQAPESSKKAIGKHAAGFIAHVNCEYSMEGQNDPSS